MQPLDPPKGQQPIAMFRSALLVAVATAAMAQDLDFFAKHVNPITEIVNKKFGNATTRFSVSGCNHSNTPFALALHA
jgi:hypothetical protein